MRISYRTLLAALMMACMINAFGAKPRASKASKAPKLTPEEVLDKAEKALKSYDIESTEDLLEQYDNLLSKNKRLKPDEDRLEEINSLLVLTRNMLDRVEKIVVIDSIVVPKEKFFHFYRLSPESGRLADASVLPRGTKIAYPGMVYVPENEIELLWAAPDSVHSYRLMSADRLADGRLSHPAPMPGNLNEKGNANFPFLMPDGITLYYANSGTNSLGGYDIFLTRKDGDEFLQPQNVGMPYNSPYDDYLLAIDETTGAGWWATDRNQIPDSVTIYIFIPNETRKNISPDDPNVKSLAMLTDIKATQTPGADYSKVRAAIAALSDAPKDKDDSHQFEFFIPGKGLYTNLEQFRTIRARDAMEKYLEIKENHLRLADRLASLRQQYAEGDHDVSTEIIRIEKQLLSAADEEAKAASAVVKSER